MNSAASWSTNVAIDEICLILTWICTTVQLQTHLNDVSEHLRIKFCPHYVCLLARFFLAAICPRVRAALSDNGAVLRIAPGRR